ncbi:MAG: class I SAM-dependent methyltransferase [Pseudomonadota bacterium]
MNKHCVICGKPYCSTTVPWLWRCEICELEVSNFKSNDGEALLGWDPEAERFMAPLRRQTTGILIGELSRLRDLNGQRLLDVGCAAGWFLIGARQAGMHASGIEPDPEIAKRALANDFEIIDGLYPHCVIAGQSYDVVTFHDVFEHFPDPNEALSATQRILEPGGILLVNLPSADGIFYRFAKLAARFGREAPLARLWQKGYESPHLFYFNTDNLQRLVSQHGFQLMRSGTLPSVSLRGLWGRIREGRQVNAVVAAMVFIGVLFSYPLLRFALPADIVFHIYQLREPA